MSSETSLQVATLLLLPSSHCVSFLQFHNFPTGDEKEGQDDKIFTLNPTSFIADVGTFHIAATQKTESLAMIREEPGAL